MSESAFSALSAAGAIWRLAKNEPAAFRRLAVRAGLDIVLCALMTAFGSLEPDSVPMALSVFIVTLGAIATIDLFFILPVRVSALVMGPDAVSALSFQTFLAMAFRGFGVSIVAEFAGFAVWLAALLIIIPLGFIPAIGFERAMAIVTPPAMIAMLAVCLWVAIRLFPIIPMRLLDETISHGRIWSATRPIRFRLLLAWSPVFALFAGLILSFVLLHASTPTFNPHWTFAIASVLVVLMLSTATLTGAATNAAIAGHVRERLRENGEA